MHIVVTGAAGLIGSHLCHRLLDDGHDVIGIDSLITGRRENLDRLNTHDAFRWVRQDICEPIDVPEPVDRVYNMACPASPADFEDKSLLILRTCSEGVRNALDLARRHNARFLQASTSECYGDPDVHPQPESYFGNVNPIGIRGPYDEGKRFAEATTFAYHRRYGLPTRIVRIFNTYGPGMRADDGRALPVLIQQALTDQPLSVYGDGSQTRSFCYVADMVEGIVRLMESDYPRPVNIGGTDEITIRQLAEEVIELTGSASTIEYRPLPDGDPKMRQPDTHLARELLGWQPTVDRPDGLSRTIDDFRHRLGLA